MATWPTAIPSGLIEQPGYPEIDMQPNGLATIEHLWKYVNYPNAINVAPRPGYFDPTFLNARCATSHISRIANGESAGWALIKASFIGFLFLPPTNVELITNRLDRPIEQHPDWLNDAVFGTWSGSGQTRIKDPDALSTVGGYAFKAWMDNSKFRGIDAFMVASFAWKVTDYILLWENPDHLFKIDNPPAVYLSNGLGCSPPGLGLTPPKWLKVQHDPEPVLFGQTPLIKRTRAWLYADVGWLPEIYG